MSCEVINPTAALPELGEVETHMITTTADVNQVKTIVNQVYNYESSEKLFPPR